MRKYVLLFFAVIFPIATFFNHTNYHTNCKMLVNFPYENLPSPMFCTLHVSRVFWGGSNTFVTIFTFRKCYSKALTQLGFASCKEQTLTPVSLSERR